MNQGGKSAKWMAFVLLFGSALVWARDTAWLSSAADALPLAAGIPLVIWLGTPWRLIPLRDRPQIPARWLVAATLAFALGWILPSITLLALAWTALAALWMRRCYQPSSDPLGLILILALSFPWLVLEWPLIGWGFRISAAVATEWFFLALQIPTQRHGTELLILGNTIRIEPACAGWNLLQLTLLAGIVIGLHDLRKRRHFVAFLVLLPLLAWVANFLRIVALSGICLSFGVETADGAWHAITGLLVIAGVIAMSKQCCQWIDPHGEMKTIRYGKS